MPQQRYDVTAPNGTTLEISGDRVPSEAELQEIFRKAGVDVPSAKASSQLETSETRSLAEQRGMPPIMDVGVGVVKGLGRTAVGLGELVSGGDPRTARSFDWAREQLKPTNTAQKVGQVGEQIGEFFAPGAGLTKLKTAAKTGYGLIDAIAGMGLEGVSAASVDAAQKGDTSDMATTGALTAGVGLGLKAVAKPVQAGLKWAGERIEKALLKPTAASLEGTTPTQMVQTLFKHKLGGTLGQTYDKVNAALSARTQQLRDILKADPSAVVDLKTAAATTLNDFTSNPQAVQAMQRIREAVEFGLNERGVKLRNGVLDLADANVAKQAVGELGAWIHDITGKTTSDADRVLEKVANKFYRHLKTAIETVATGDVGAINKEISELIPIKHAIIRRIPVAERSNVLNLGDMFGVSSSTMGLSLANRLLQSGRVANAAVAAGTADATKAATAAARVAGASQ